MSIKRILVPIDGSKNSFRGLDEAILIARKCQATLTALYVTPLTPPETDAQISYIEKHLLKKAANFMTQAKTRAAQNGVLLYDKILYGEEGPNIIKYAIDKKFDLIVIGSRGLGKAREIFLGSTSNYILHKSSKPVLIVK